MTPYFLLDLYGKPYRLNYVGRWTLCKCIGFTFAQDVIGAVDISTDLASIFGAVQAISSPYPLSTKDVLFFIVGLVGRDRIEIKKAGFAGIALFRDFHLDADKRGFVRNHLDEARMRNAHKVLVVFLPQIALLLPQGVLPDNDGSYSLFNQEFHDALANRVQGVIDLPVALVGDAFHLARDPLSILFGKLLLEFLHALVVPLVPRFYRTTVNQSRDKTLTV